MNKNSVMKKFNSYFLFMALALSASIYLWALDSGITYTSKIDIMLSPKNIKTSVYLDRAKENLATIFKKNININDDAHITTFEKNSLVSLEATDENKQLALDLSQENLVKFLNITSKYYDIKNDLNVEVVNRSIVKNRKSILYLLTISVFGGLVLAFIIQTLLDVVDKFTRQTDLKKKVEKKEIDMSRGIQSDLKNILNFNKEKIKRLSEDVSLEENLEMENSRETIFDKNESKKEDTKMNNSDESQRMFKKSSSPVNLPIASLENDNANSMEKNTNQYEIEKEGMQNKTEENIKDPTQEPTENDFKERLNQLLRGE